MKQTKKQLQVGVLLQKEFSTVLQREGAFLYGSQALVTVTRVRMSSDMGIAYIYLSVYNIDNKDLVIKALWDNLSRLRGELGKRVGSQLRRMPNLKFFIDDTLDEAESIERIFDHIHAEQAASDEQDDEEENPEENQD